MKLTQRNTVLIAIILVVIACFFAVYLRLFTGKELWYEMFAAILGVIITALITMILLKGQSDDDVKRERDAKVFAEKLKVYQEYLQTLCKVVEKRNLSDENKIGLEFQTACLAMHCDAQYIEQVSAGVKEIIQVTCVDEAASRDDEGKSDSPEPLLNALFHVVEAFRKDLYDSNFSFDLMCKRNSLNYFSEAYRDAKNESGVENVCNGQQKEDASNALKGGVDNHSIWADAKKRWALEGWMLEELENGTNIIKVSRVDNPGYISLFFENGHYCIQATYLNDTDFSKPLKWKRGGRRNGGRWWQALPETYTSIPEGQFMTYLYCHLELQYYLVENIEQLQTILFKHHRTALWKNEIGVYQHWKIFIWYWDMLACELADEKEGIPYMDIIEKEGDGKVLIQLANRLENHDILRKTLKRIGCEDKEQGVDGYVILEKVASTDAVEVGRRVKYWIEKLNA